MSFIEVQVPDENSQIVNVTIDAGGPGGGGVDAEAVIDIINAAIVVADDPSTARPSGYLKVWWYMPAEPTNATDLDEWIQTEE